MDLLNHISTLEHQNREKEDSFYQEVTRHKSTTAKLQKGIFNVPPVRLLSILLPFPPLPTRPACIFLALPPYEQVYAFLPQPPPVESIS